MNTRPFASCNSLVLRSSMFLSKPASMFPFTSGHREVFASPQRTAPVHYQTGHYVDMCATATRLSVNGPLPLGYLSLKRSPTSSSITSALPCQSVLESSRILSHQRR